MAPIAAEILNNIALSPERVHEKGHLLTFYGIILTSDDSFDEQTKMKLKWNLWLCLNDARLLLQPSELNIQALILLACHVQDFHTPSLCWMVSTTAFRMLQALGLSNLTMNTEAKQRRYELFWFLNSLDKLLALIFGRPPVFHRAMCEEIPMPSMQRLRVFQPHLKASPQSETTPSSSASLFGAHVLHQMHLVSKVMGDIWYYLFDDHGRPAVLEETRENLNSWFEDTSKVNKLRSIQDKTVLRIVGTRSFFID